MSKLLFCLVAVLALSACGGDTDDDVVEAAVEVPSTDGEFTDTVVAADSLTTNHVEPPVSFSQSPSFGGDHYGFWQNCGFYDVPVIEGAATHSLEHGVVWITYNTDLLTDTELDELRGMAAANDRLLISPYDQPEPVVLSAWGAQRRGADLRPGDSAVADFIDAWQDNPELVEAGALCSRAAGFPPDDARTLENGEVAPEEFN
ncbi:MAG: DUF3105 domain-containing protein [Acidimicrobiales bacterium]